MYQGISTGSSGGISIITSVDIVNLFPIIDEFSPQRELFRAISAKNGVKLPFSSQVNSQVDNTAPGEQTSGESRGTIPEAAHRSS